jgi:hypothetical protein
MAQDNAPPPERPSLYDRLGGVYNIATVVDDLIDRVMTDSRLNANPRVDEATTGSRRRDSSSWSPSWPAKPPAGRSSTLAGRWATRTGTS